MKHNLKLILGLVWSLVLNYQAGIQRHLMEWINALLPKENITNFCSNWRDGRNLSALVNYCKPGLIPEHASLDPNNRLANVTHAMDLADKHFGIPPVMHPEDLAVEKPDELSIMTYLSYFSAIGGPAACALLTWINKQASDLNVTNFTTDWVSGHALGSLINGLSRGHFPRHREVLQSGGADATNCQQAMDAALDLLGVRSTLTAAEFATSSLNQLHIQRMAYLAQFEHVNPLQHEVSEPRIGEELVLPLQCGSPYEIDLTTVAQPDKVKCTEICPIYHSHLGKSIQIPIDVSEAGKGTLEASCCGETCGEVEAKIESDTNGMSEVVLVPQVHDKYTLSIYFAREHIKGSPFSFDVCPLPPAANRVKIVQQVPSSIKPGDQVTMTLDTSEAGNGALTVKCTGDQVGEIAAEVWPVKNAAENEACSLEVVRITLPKQDTYHISVLWAETNIPGSPFKVNAITPYNPNSPTCRLIEQDELSFRIVGKPTCFKLDVIAVGHGILEASVTDPLHAKTELSTEADANCPGLQSVYFTPSITGVHTFTVLWSGKHVPGSPVTFNVIAPENCTFGLPVKLEVKVDTKLKHLKALVMGPGKNERTHNKKFRTTTMSKVAIDKSTTGTFQLQFTPSALGIHELHVMRKGIHIPESPFYYNCSMEAKTTYVGSRKFSILSRRSSTRSSSTSIDMPTRHPKRFFDEDDEIVGLDLENERLVLGLPFKFKLHCEELGEGAPEIRCDTEGAAEIEILPAPGENSYQCAVTPMQDGRHVLVITFDGKHILGSPFHVAFEPQGDAQKCKMVKTLAECSQQAGDNIVVCISTKGAGRGRLTAKLKNATTRASMPVTVTHPYKSHYNIQFDPMKELDYKLSVMYDSTHIYGSPFQIRLGDAGQCLAEGEGLSAAQINKWSRFIVHTEDAGDGKLDVLIQGEDGMAVQTDIILSGSKYDVLYQPTQSGTCTIQVLWSEVHIPGSPFKALCVDPNQLQITDRVSAIVIGRPVKFMVVSEIEMTEDKLTVFAKHNHERIYGQVERVEDLMYACTIQLPKSGKYSIHARWGKTPIAGSPFKMEVVDGASARDFKVEASELENGMMCIQIVGPKQAFQFGEMTASMENQAEHEAVPVEVCQTSNETCMVEFKPTPGLLSIFYEKVHILGSPFQLISTDTIQCRVEGKGVQAARVHSWNWFSVTTKSVGYGQLDVKIEKEGGNGVKIDPYISANDDSHYHIVYLPESCGVYLISVTWGEHEVTGSPFRVPCCDPASYSIGDIPNQVMAGSHQALTVRAAHKPMTWECITATLNSQSGTETNVPLTMTADGIYSDTLTMTKSDHYKLHVYCCGFEISNSPHKFTVLDPPMAAKIKAQGPGLSDGQVGANGEFTIDASEGGNGYINLKVHGPHNGFKIDMKHEDTDKNIVLAQYNPSHAGEYKIHILWSGEHIPGSPFSVRVSRDNEGPKGVSHMYK